MVIQTQLNDGKETRTKVYRNVFKQSDITKLVEGFMAQRNIHKWGQMVILKGTERKIFRKFGTPEVQNDS